MVIARTSGKNNDAQINDWLLRAMAGSPMNRIIFQPDGTRMYPIFHHSIVPLFSALYG